MAAWMPTLHAPLAASFTAEVSWADKAGPAVAPARYLVRWAEPEALLGVILTNQSVARLPLTGTQEVKVQVQHVLDCFD